MSGKCSKWLAFVYLIDSTGTFYLAKQSALNNILTFVSGATSIILVFAMLPKLSSGYAKSLVQLE